MGFFLHRFGVFSTLFGVEKTPKAAQEKMTTGKAQHAKTFLKELHCSGKEGVFSTPLWGFYYTIYGVFITPLWGFFYTFMGFLLPFTRIKDTHFENIRISGFHLSIFQGSWLRRKISTSE